MRMPLGVPPREKLKACGRVTGGFISRSLGRTVSGRLRGPHSPSSGLAVSQRSSTDRRKPVGNGRAAQPAHAADRLPRRVPSILALASRLLGEYTCHQSRPANTVAVRLSHITHSSSGCKTPAADAHAVGRRGFSEILFRGDSTARLAWESIPAVGGKLTRRVTHSSPGAGIHEPPRRNA